MIRRPPRSTQSRSSAASDVYKRQPLDLLGYLRVWPFRIELPASDSRMPEILFLSLIHISRAHETRHDLVCRLLLEKKKKKKKKKKKRKKKEKKEKKKKKKKKEK